eukprot:jgi/Botrbrau1/19753/Bobra.0124s0006.1
MYLESPVSLVICFLVAACFTSCSGAPSKADRVVQWAKDSGATIHVRIGQVHPSGLRGTIAEKDFTEGEIIAEIPLNLTVELGSVLLPTTDQFQNIPEPPGTNYPERYKKMQPIWDANTRPP